MESLARGTNRCPSGSDGYNEAVEKRRMCPNCRAFITTADRVCPYCGVQLGPRAVDLRRLETASVLLPRVNTTSAIILTINVAFYLIELAVNARVFSAGVSSLDLRTLISLGAKQSMLIHAGQGWRLLTAGFLHGGLFHIAMNSWVLFDLVGEVEQFYGTSRLVFAYVFSTFTGFLLSYLWHPGSVSVGASAACFGLIGIMLAMGLRDRADPLAQAVRTYYGRWAVYAIVFSFLPGGIDIAAHLGGLAGGFLVGWIARLPGRPGTSGETIWRLLAGAALVAVMYAFVMDYFSFRALAPELSSFQGS